MDCTLQNLISLVAEHAIVDPADITPESAFGSLGFDSLDHIELIIEAEDLFNVEIPEQVANACHTVGDLHQAILNAEES
jgi:acyl carrier protein